MKENTQRATPTTEQVMVKHSHDILFDVHFSKTFVSVILQGQKKKKNLIFRINGLNDA